MSDLVYSISTFIRWFFRTNHKLSASEFSVPNCAMGLPTMTCFIPSLEAGSPFHISIHSWVQNPEASAFTKAITKHPELVKFQARIYFDGCLIG